MVEETNRSLLYNHPVYGRIKILDPLVLKIINTKEFQRLKKIDQAGYKELLVKPNADLSNYRHTRYAHSLGVYYLLKKVGASVEEQIAGLIHDVSHSAFSHCVDYAISEGSEKEHNLQDSIHDRYVENSSIAKIISDSSFSLEKILDDNNYPLKEKKLPDLCADRIEYVTLTAVVMGEINHKKAKKLIDSLVAINKDWVFKDYSSALSFTKLFKKMNDVHYSGFLSGVMFAITGDYLKYALQKGYIKKEELWTHDKKVLEIINKNLIKDEKLSYLWKLMNRKLKCNNDMKKYNRHVYLKSRAVDPLFIENGEIKRVSNKLINWKTALIKELTPKEYFIQYQTTQGEI